MDYMYGAFLSVLEFDSLWFVSFPNMHFESYHLRATLWESVDIGNLLIC